VSHRRSNTGSTKKGRWRSQRVALWAFLAALPTGCAWAFDFGGFEAAATAAAVDGATIDSQAADGTTSDASSPGKAASLKIYGLYRAWSDGTYAASCDGYRHPGANGYAYEGATGSGVYAVKPARAESPVRVFCDMTVDGDAWTLITSSTFDDRKSGSATTQTLDCTSLTSYCNVAGEPWDYEVLRHTWSDCVGGEARITKAQFQDDSNACNNQVDSLLFTFDSPAFVGMKGWQDCTFQCIGESWFAGQRITLQFQTLVTDPKFITSVNADAGLVRVPPSQGCDGGAYGCWTGYDNIWLR
jgi:hypothetical protein